MKPGIYDLPHDEYLSDPCDRPSLNSGIARILCTSSPLHAWTAHPKLNPDWQHTVDEKFDVGTVAHDLLLAGSDDKLVVVSAADWRTKEAKEARAEARANGHTALLAHQRDEVVRMLAELYAQLERRDIDPPLFQAGKPEQTVIWEEDGGVVCRARLDWLRDSLTAVDDYKTTSRTANPESWSRTLFSMGYDVQAAFYLRGLQAVTGASAGFRFVVQETYPPYALSVVSLAPAAMELAVRKVEYAIGLWRDCFASDEWPAYPTQVCWASPPAWEEARWLEREEVVTA